MHIPGVSHQINHFNYTVFELKHLNYLHSYCIRAVVHCLVVSGENKTPKEIFLAHFNLCNLGLDLEEKRPFFSPVLFWTRSPKPGQILNVSPFYFLVPVMSYIYDKSYLNASTHTIYSRLRFDNLYIIIQIFNEM